jgi:actin-related protein
MSQGISRMNVGGRDLTEYLINLLVEKEYQFVSSSEKEVIRRMKEQFCYVAYDFEQEMTNCKAKAASKTFELPDGQIVKLDSERFQVSDFYSRWQKNNAIMKVPGSPISTIFVGIRNARIGRDYV